MTKTQIYQLVQAFSEKTLPKSEWTHKAHIIVAFWHNWHFDFETAFKIVKEKIIAYNEAVGTENSDTSGYHETLTMFWMQLTKSYITDNDFKSIEVACSKFLNSPFASKNYPFDFYTKEELFSVNARKEWVKHSLKNIDSKK